MQKGILFLILFSIAAGSFFFYVRNMEKAAPYLSSGQSGTEDAKDRVMSGTIGSISWAIEKDGFFGSGLGTTTQGARHLGVATGGKFIESGPGKIVSELGVPGAIALFMIFLAYLRDAYKNVIKGIFKDTGEITGVFLLAL
ncbi:MAG: hypothetical protein WCK38_02005, partial [Candidatus Omnitrophota bacterium]